MKDKKKKTFANQLKSKFKSFDLFGDEVNFSINNDSKLRSCTGACLSLVLLSLILFYT